MPDKNEDVKARMLAALEEDLILII